MFDAHIDASDALSRDSYSECIQKINVLDGVMAELTWINWGENKKLQFPGE